MRSPKGVFLPLVITLFLASACRPNSIPRVDRLIDESVVILRLEPVDRDAYSYRITEILKDTEPQKTHYGVGDVVQASLTGEIAEQNNRKSKLVFIGARNLRNDLIDQRTYEEWEIVNETVPPLQGITVAAIRSKVEARAQKNRR
ncbi:MAG: hypothetical protein JWM88_930 [Verrucomicrobia bacterium]|nr:hypothetical protein [Verrucomicrobiota bacterium]